MNDQKEMIEKVKEFHKKGVIKRRIIQGDINMAFDMAEIAESYEQQNKDIELLTKVVKKLEKENEKLKKENCIMREALEEIDGSNMAAGYAQKIPHVPEATKDSKDIVQCALSQITP